MKNNQKNISWEDLQSRLRKILAKEGKKRRKYIIPVPFLLYRIALIVLAVIALFAAGLIILWHFLGADFDQIFLILKLLVISSLIPVFAIIVRLIARATGNGKTKKNDNSWKDQKIMFDSFMEVGYAENFSCIPYPFLVSKAIIFLPIQLEDKI